MTIFLAIALTALAALNAHASLRCFRDPLSSRGQRWAQVAFIWLVPFLGAALALHMTRGEPERGAGMYPRDRDLGGPYVTGLGRNNDQGYIRSPDDDFHQREGGGDHAGD